jgi:hypothetical protein
VSRYPVRYRSASKGEVEIEDMATPHLANAWRKLGKQIDEASGVDVDGDGEATNMFALVFLHKCMEVELESRGCTFDPDTGQWTFPEKEGA